MNNNSVLDGCDRMIIKLKDVAYAGWHVMAYSINSVVTCTDTIVSEVLVGWLVYLFVLSLLVIVRSLRMPVTIN